ncbi:MULTISPECIES: replication-relaxation family protein [Amycolatopsis]|uniref:Replication-relaxation family protein n=1 Tax=Amycolatopsis echigonensis TaxID=2576905 RepID=A0A8E1VUE2_9PSEU|nr:MULTISPECIES: replication-relaxation family protein [Amycolatopsis]MBB2498470.1 replication-relaxation family protein [Amycolatopsis echigonensis]
MVLDPFQLQALLLTYWHRLVSTDQLGRLIAPGLPLRTVRHKLAVLRRTGLLDAVTREHSPRAWYATADGAAMAEVSDAVEPRQYRVADPEVAQVLLAHSLDVVETGLAFVETARAHGHDCGPLSWTPEVAHHRDGRRATVIADAVLHYVLDEGSRSQRIFFLELDRSTMPVARLAQKLVAYVRYHDYVPRRPGASPVWRARYPRFPRVVIVLSGAAEHVLERRLADLRAHAQALPPVASASDRVDLVVTTLRRLQNEGVLADVAVPILGTDTRRRSLFAPLRGNTR